MKGFPPFSAVLRAWFAALFAGLLGLHTLSAQDLDGRWLELNVLRGTLLKIYPTFPEHDPNTTIDLSYTWSADGSKYWHEAYNFPDLGLSLSVADFGNDSILGQSLTLHTSLTFRWPLTQWMHLELRPSAGLAYWNKPYDRFENPRNEVIGAPTTAAVFLFAGTRFRLGEQLSVRLGGEFRHYSNGHSRVPNIGANNAMISGGVAYSLGSSGYQGDTTLPLPPARQWRVNAEFVTGRHEVEGTVNPKNGPAFPVFGGLVSVARRISASGQVSLGSHWTYYRDYHAYILTQEIFEDNRMLKSSKAVAFIGYEWFMGRLAFHAQAGFNLYFPYRRALVEKALWPGNWLDDNITNRIGFNYYLLDPHFRSEAIPYLSIGLRTISGKADFFEFGLGLTI